MKRNKKYNNCLIIFDFDGVLVNSIGVMELAWKEVIKKFNLKISFDSYRDQIGLPFHTILKKLGVVSRQREIYNTFHKVSLKNQKKIKLYKSVKPTINFLKKRGYMTAIVTSKNSSRVTKLVKELKIPIKNIVCPSKKYRGKPYPDQIIEAIRKTKKKPDKIFYVGDMNVDFQLSKNSKAEFIFCKYGYEKKKKIYKNNISKFYELRKIFK